MTMGAAVIPEAFKEILARLERPRHAKIAEVELLLSEIHLTNDDLPEVISILDLIFAGIEDSEEEVDHYLKYLNQALDRLERRQTQSYQPDECDLARWKRDKDL